MYHGLMNLWSESTGGDERVLTGDPDAKVALGRLSTWLGGETLEGATVTEALIPADALSRIATAPVAVTLKTEAAAPKFAAMPAASLLARGATDAREATRRVAHKYSNPNARAVRWPNGVPEHVLADIPGDMKEDF